MANLNFLYFIPKSSKIMKKYKKLGEYTFEIITKTVIFETILRKMMFCNKINQFKLSIFSYNIFQIMKKI